MASGQTNRSLAARAAAILTTGEVAATALDLNEAWAESVSVHADFTIGSLTNVVLRFYASMDGTTYYQIFAGSSVLVAQVATLTATASIAIPLPQLLGWKFFRATAQGTGTVTSSSLALTYRYARRGSQG